MANLILKRPGDIGQLLASVRTSRGIRQEDLAEELGVSRTYLASLESGRATTQLTRMFRVMKTLGIELQATFDTNPESTAAAGRHPRG